MKKYLYLLCLPTLMALAFAACSDDGGDETGGDEEDGVKVEVTYENLVGEWICYYQHWEEGANHESESYYNTDDLSITFNADKSGYLKSESSKDELLEIGRSEYFRYSISGKNIYSDEDDVPWIIMSLTTTTLTLKRQDGDYIIIAKFTKRKSLAGNVSELQFSTDYGDGEYNYHAYIFYYDFKGELNGIGYLLGSFDENDKLTFEPLQDGVRYVNWYNGGDRLRVVDNRDSGRYAEVFHNNTSVARAEYDADGYLVSVTNGRESIEYKYSVGNMSSLVQWELELKYEYSKEKNDASVDLNYFIDYFAPSNGQDYGYNNYLELGLAGKASENLISQIVTPEDFDYYFTYSYEKDAGGRISKITRKCIDRWGDDLLNTCTITVKYYDE